MNLDLVTVGETMVVFAPDPPGLFEDATSFDLQVGGAESNVAAHLASAGFKAVWASRLGGDPMGRLILKSLARRGVDLTHVAIVADRPTGLYLKETDASSSRAYYYRSGSAASTLDTQDADRLPLGKARFVHLTGITPGLSDSCDRMTHRVVERVSELRQTKLSFDVNYRPTIWSASNAGQRLLELACRADLVFVGLDEAGLLWGASSATDIRTLMPEVSTLVVKDAAIGAYEFTDSGETFSPTPPADVVEPIGAGDAFAAGYLRALLGTGRGGATALEAGHELAAQVLGAAGDMGET